MIRDIILVFIATDAFLTFLALAFYLNSRNHEGYTGSALPYLLYPLVISAFTSVFTMLSSMWQKNSVNKRIEKLIRDTSEISIMPLFDDYTVSLSDEKSKYFFTTQYLKGHIAGLPVEVHCNPGSRSSYANISIDIRVSKKGYVKMEDRIDTRLTYYVNMFTKKLEKDIKPELLKQIARLKENGYLPMSE